MAEDKLLFGSRKEGHYYLSNFAHAPIVVGGLTFKTNEHYFQWCKFEDSEVEHKKRILESSTPSEAKKLGRSRKHKMRSDWDEHRIVAMAHAIYYKFEQHPKLKEKLLSTGESELVENAPWDSYWGNGKDGNGKNMLGKLLVQYRTFARKELFDSTN